MVKTGIIRRFDDLGRIAVPKEVIVKMEMQKRVADLYVYDA